MISADLSAFTEMIYDACLEEQRWNESLQTVAEFCGGIGIVIRDLKGGRPKVTTSPGCRDAVAAYTSGWWQYDTIASIAARMDLLREGIIWDDDFIPSAVKERDVFFQEFLRPQGIGSRATTITDIGSGELFAVNVQRPLGHPPPDLAERKRFADVSRHVSRALAIRMRLARSEGVHTELARRLSAFDCAVAILDWTGRVVETNEAFAMLSTEGLAIRHRRLVLGSPKDQRRFDELLHAVMLGGATDATLDTLLIRRTQSVLPLLLRATPLAARASDRLLTSAPTHGALVMVLEPGHGGYPDVSTVLIMLGLTPAQARVCLLIADGNTPRLAAETLKVSEETVRTQLKHVYARLGISGQSDIVRLVAKAAAFR